MKLFTLISFLLIAPATNAAVDVPDKMADRVKACTICHGDKDRVEPHIYFPRIGGKPQGYLFNQLRNFRDGRRYYRPMAILLENMSDDYLMEIAQYFSTQPLPAHPPEQRLSMLADEIVLAERLIYSGSPKRDIPACNTCHGNALMGVEPYIPGILGLTRTYIAAQFGSWRNGGLRRGQVSNCMSEIAEKLTDEEIDTIAKWLASQPISGNPEPDGTLPHELNDRCSSIALDGSK